MILKKKACYFGGGGKKVNDDERQVGQLSGNVMLEMIESDIQLIESGLLKFIWPRMDRFRRLLGKKTKWKKHLITRNHKNFRHNIRADLDHSVVG